MSCPCGGVILADTEDWPTPLCHDCWFEKEAVDLGDGVKFIVDWAGVTVFKGGESVLLKPKQWFRLMRKMNEIPKQG